MYKKAYILTSVFHMKQRGSKCLRTTPQSGTAIFTNRRNFHLCCSYHHPVLRDSPVLLSYPTLHGLCTSLYLVSFQMGLLNQTLQ